MQLAQPILNQREQQHPVAAWYFWVLFLLILAWSHKAWAINSYSVHDDYLNVVEQEPSQASFELEALARPSVQVPLQQRIFDEKITKEFKDRYAERFGGTETLQAYFDPNRLSYYTIQQDYAAKQNYANYMIRRLAEYHAEKYFTSEPGLKTVWDVKEAVSQAQVGNKNFKIKGQYNISANLVEMNMETPFVNARLTTKPDGKSSADSALILSRVLNPKLSIEARYKFEGTVYLTGSKKLGPNLAANLTFAKDAKNNTLLTSYRESIALAGLTYTY
jgi:hypothetical protein